MNTTLYATINSTSIKSTARATTVDLVYKALVDALGADNVSMVGSGDIAINTGISPNNTEVNCVVSISAKDFYDRKTKSKVFTTYDRAAEAAAYQNKLAEKAESKKRKKEGFEEA
jgi:hypothetical protein